MSDLEKTGLSKFGEKQKNVKSRKEIVRLMVCLMKMFLAMNKIIVNIQALTLADNLKL